MKIALLISSAVWTALAVVAGLGLSLAFSGPIRAATELPIGGALGLSALLLFSVAAYLWREKLVHRCATTASICAAILFIGSFSYFESRLYFPLYHGLVSVGGGDAGIHAHFQRMFIEREPDAYQSFVSFFALTYWLEQLFHLNTFESFRSAFYGELILIFALLAVLPWLVSRELPFRSSSSVVRFFLLAALFGFLPFDRIIVPTLHYLQAEGFYPQLTGLLPVLIVWCAFVGIDNFPRRLMVVCFGIALSRFTYGLNLPDLLLTAAAILFLDAKVAPDLKQKIISNPLAAILWVLALLGYQQLFTVFDMKGAIVKTDLAAVVRGQLLLSLALLAVPGTRGFEVNSPGLRRMYQFAGYFGLIGAGVGMMFLYGGTPPSYYPFKHAFYSSMLCAVAICIASAQLLAQRFDRVRAAAQVRKFPEAALVAVLVAAFVGLWQLKIGYEPYQPSYRERAQRLEHPKLLTPLADLEAWSIIERTLGERRASFGGFITPSWPISSFMNASFGFFGELPFYRSGKPPAQNRACVFWNSDAQSRAEFEQLALERVIAEIGQLNSAGDRTTVRYIRSTDHTERELSIRCSG